MFYKTHKFRVSISFLESLDYYIEFNYIYNNY